MVHVHAVHVAHSPLLTCGVHAPCVTQAVFGEEDALADLSPSQGHSPCTTHTVHYPHRALPTPCTFPSSSARRTRSPTSASARPSALYPHRSALPTPCLGFVPSVQPLLIWCTVCGAGAWRRIGLDRLGSVWLATRASYHRSLAHRAASMFDGRQLLTPRDPLPAGLWAARPHMVHSHTVHLPLGALLGADPMHHVWSRWVASSLAALAAQVGRLAVAVVAAALAPPPLRAAHMARRHVRAAAAGALAAGRLGARGGQAVPRRPPDGQLPRQVLERGQLR